MSERADNQSWDRYKDVIRTLYIVEGLKLGGSDGVMKVMENRHSFKATKAQYEKRLKEWGFNKKQKKKDWEIVSRKLEKRKRDGKESNVYINGQLIPTKKLRKETSRQGFMTFAEQLMRTQETPPQTPHGFEISTPSAQPLFLRPLLENLPMYQFQDKVPSFSQHFSPFDPDRTALASVLGRSPKSGMAKHEFSIIDAILPLSGSPEEGRASRLAIQRHEQLDATKFLDLATFLLSNNLPAETRGEDFYQWFKDHGSTHTLRALSVIREPTAEALLESLFRLAVEAEDVPNVKHLLKAGVNPNGHLCRYHKIPDTMTPLQFACIRGNADLAHELIKAGSVIDEPKAGWKRSALVLAIIGRYVWYNAPKVNENRDERSDLEDKDEQSDLEEDIEPLFTLVQALIDAGASVNLVDIGPSGVTGPLQGWPQYLHNPFLAFILEEDHSPITAASKYRCLEVVELLIQKGADVTPRSLELGLKIGCFDLCDTLLAAGLPLTNDVVELTIQRVNDSLEHQEWAKRLLASRQDSEAKQVALCEAMRCSAISMVDYLLEFESSHFPEPFQRSPELEDAIVRCFLARNSNILCRVLDWKLNFGLFLNLAMSGGYLDIVEILVSAGVRPSQLELESGRALKAAVRSGNQRFIHMVLTAGAVPNIHGSHCGAPDRFHSRSGDILVEAIQRGRQPVIEAILGAGADINAPGRSIWSGSTCGCLTPLVAAILMENWILVNVLIHLNVTVNNPPGMLERRTSLSAAVQKRNIWLVQFLLQAGANPEDAAALKGAIGNIELLQILLAALDNYAGPCKDPCVGCPALSTAIRNKDTVTIEAILDRGLADINSLQCGTSALYDALIADYSPDSNIMRLLLRSGANPNGIAQKIAQNIALNFGLNFAQKQTHGSIISERHLQKVQLLLEAGMRVNLPLAPNTPASLIQLTEDVELMRLLLSWGADPNAISECKKYKAAIQQAAIDQSIGRIQILLKYGAKPDAISPAESNTALQIATRDGSKEIVEILLEHGADVNSPPAEKNGATALQFAALGGFLSIAQILLEKGADVNAAPALVEGRTALEGAAEHGRVDMIQLLLNAGATVCGDGKGQYERALMRASKNGHHATRRLLESHFAQYYE